MSTKPAIAFFGATGGCTAAALALALEGGYLVSALARTPSKLRDILAKNHGISESTINRNLVIVQGDVKDVAAVRKTLTPNNRLVDIIVSGIGGTPVMQASLFQPVSLNDPSICADAARTVVQALSGLPPAAGARRPTMIVISTTGTDLKTPDVPFLLRGLYHWLLAVPHIDKRQMEDAVVAAYKEGVLGGFVVVRPTLLVDGDRRDPTRCGRGGFLRTVSKSLAEMTLPAVLPLGIPSAGRMWGDGCLITSFREVDIGRTVASR